MIVIAIGELEDNIEDSLYIMSEYKNSKVKVLNDGKLKDLDFNIIYKNPEYNILVENRNDINSIIRYMKEGVLNNDL